MPALFFRIKAYLSYWLNAVDEHSLHSPFFFDLYTTRIKPAPAAGQYELFESLRAKLLHDYRTVVVDDLGTGATRKSTRKIADIARSSLSPRRYSTIYSRLAAHLNARCIIELGTSFGINTLYLAANPESSVTTFEGAPAIAEIAALTFQFSGNKNIDLVTGDIEKTLPNFLQGIRKVDLAFIDANHRYEPSVRYFEWLAKKSHEKTVVIIDDIHHSAEMEKVWETIKSHRLVYASADLFRCGIVFFDPSLNKQHVILQV